MNAVSVNVAKAMLATFVFTLALGCEQKKQQTYNEAVQLYAAEMTELERLEARREVLIRQKEGIPDPLDLKSTLDLVDSVVAEQEKVTKGLLDPAQQNKSSKAEESLRKVKEGLDKQAELDKKSKVEADKLRLEAERELPQLELQIEKQKARVELARKAKEALAP